MFRCLALVLLCACPRPAPPEVPVSSPAPVEAPPEPEAVGTPRLALPVQDAVCAGQACWVLTSGELRPLAVDALALGEPIAQVPDGAVLGTRSGEIGWETGGSWTGLDGTSEELSPPAPAIDELPFEASDLLARWNALTEQGARVPFERAWPLPDGGILTVQPGLMGRTSSLVRVGGRALAISLPSGEAPVRLPGTIALHPTGSQVYHLSWPSGALGAYETTSLREVWRLDLPPAAHGLFVTRDGRFLLAGAGGSISRDRLTDYPLIGPLRSGEGPASDPALMRRPRPSSSVTAVVDLVAPELLVETAGSFLRWIRISENRYLLVTTRGVLRIDVAPASTSG